MAKGTAYQYDPRLRLRALSTSGPQGSLIDFSYDFDGASNIRRIDDNRGGLPANSPRRNTQVFAYDNLYRITSATYPDTGASITYDYDRIGNMLSQNSNIADQENGLPVVNLGAMSYGGSAGPGGRQGRDQGQPGPHALTAVSGGSRTYAYDANGNMENIDGLACTWDFKDRLVAVENDEMRAEYTYDYTDRRITKKITPKSSPSTPNPQPSTSVSYPHREFEVRDFGEPVKYVWNGETRVARVTRTLNASERIQRFALQPGWNVLALAVTLTDGDTQLRRGPVDDVVRHAPDTNTYHRLTAGETVPAGTLLRVHTTAATTLAVRGAWTAPSAVSVPAGRQWLANTRFAPLDLAATVPANDPLWFWQPDTQSWHIRIPELPTASTHPAKLQPGEALFTVVAAPYTISAPDPTLDIRFYHQDHLGSSSVMSDAAGQLVSETAFYPFGYPRHELEPRGVKEPYGFTQKERDVESELNYFEARYHHPALARFISQDPIYRFRSALMQSNWASENGMAYAHCNPLKKIDPSGMTAMDVTEGMSGSPSASAPPSATIQTSEITSALIDAGVEVTEEVVGNTFTRGQYFNLRAGYAHHGGAPMKATEAYSLAKEGGAAAKSMFGAVAAGVAAGFDAVEGDWVGATATVASHFFERAAAPLAILNPTDIADTTRPEMRAYPGPLRDLPTMNEYGQRVEYSRAPTVPRPSK